MKTKNTPMVKTNQVTLSHLKSQDETEQLWDENKQSLKRFKLNFPDLSDSFAPDWLLLPTALANLQQFEDNRGGLSANTLKMLAFVIRKWDAFCKNESLYSFPIQPTFLANWFKALRLEGLSINSVKQYRAQLSLFHKLMGIEDLTKDPIIATFFKSLAKDEMELTGSQIIELQAKPFRKHHLNKLMQLWGNEGYAIAFRDLTLLTVAYGTLLREGEIGNIRKKHVKILDNGDINIERVTSKTSVSPEPKRLTGRFSSIVRTYLSRYCSGLDDNDFIFCWLTTLGQRPAAYRQTPMSGMTVDRIYQRAHTLLEKQGDVVTSSHAHRDIWSGHSSRVGALQDGYAAGLSLTQLIQLGDWKSNTMVLRYLRGLDNQNSPNLLLQD
ncbi:integrase [Vibrio sp. 10N.286.49.B3]|uniref:tyrosine-type recombinase/integrase n=1 Tax=Vibrio sp. 10N.286.49.B3 TaxID=1880855 RepID=UPI000C8360BC|nr:tyrosine-type recombinase/integrase [Vibrio sp. 10N.286.49.B3]PMH44791.1 integrase [Vibrio sp. 10N.286.49.B3]